MKAERHHEQEGGERERQDQARSAAVGEHERREHLGRCAWACRARESMRTRTRYMDMGMLGVYRGERPRVVPQQTVRCN